MVQTDTFIKQNLWWKHNDGFKRYDFHITEVGKANIEFNRGDIELKPGIYVITGPRQIGKTVWVKKKIMNLLENKVNPRSIFYLSCDALTSKGRKELRRATNYFFQTALEFEKTYIFLDEINYIHDWIYEIKTLADEGIFSKSIVVLTGSSSSEIRRKTELIPGRGLEGNTYFLKPLSFREFIIQTINKMSFGVKNPEMLSSLKKLQEIIKDCSVCDLELNQIKKKVSEIFPFKNELDYMFNIYLITGGFPNVINNYLKNKKETIDNSIFETFIRIIMGDFAKTGKLENTAKQILYGILKRIGTRYSYSSLSKETETGITHPTIIDYLDLFEKSFIIQILNSYDFNKKNIRPKADKKIYFTDPFIYHAVNTWINGREIDTINEFIVDEKSLSTLIESVVFSHLERLKEIPIIKDKNSFLWFYYNRNKEIDFLFKSDDYLGIEVKYQFSPSVSEILKIEKIKNYIVITKDKFEIYDNIIFIPVSIFLSLLVPSNKKLL